jgi:uncharacterized protein
MYFVVLNIDRPDGGNIRQRLRAEHRTYIHGDLGPATLRLAGPLLAEDDETMIGSLLVVEAANRESVERIVKNDPFCKADLFASSVIHGWSWMTGIPR